MAHMGAPYGASNPLIFNPLTENCLLKSKVNQSSRWKLSRSSLWIPDIRFLYASLDPCYDLTSGWSDEFYFLFYFNFLLLEIFKIILILYYDDLIKYYFNGFISLFLIEFIKCEVTKFSFLQNHVVLVIHTKNLFP